MNTDEGDRTTRMSSDSNGIALSRREFIALTAGAVSVGAGSVPASPEPKYLLFWSPPDRASWLVRKVGAKGDGRTRILGFGLPNMTIDAEGSVAGNIHSAFKAAREQRVAVFLHFDFHVAWESRRDLWNWFDPNMPGYNPANKNNVEWFGWDGPPAKVRYLNWGVPTRMAPPMCFTSKAVRREWTRLINKVIAPPLKEEMEAMKRQGLANLFAGVLVGSEPTLDNYAHPDPETAKMIASDGGPRGQLGYRALLDRGFSKSKPPADLRFELSKVVQETVAFWCKTFVDAGFSSQKLYPHVPSGGQVEMTSAPPWAAFNAWSRPGWSTYPSDRLAEGFGILYAELRKHGNPPWGGVEANAGIPGSMVDWETYLAWHYNHGAVIVGVNTGATGTELPTLLEKSAYGDEALKAYRKFLSGKKLVEKPLAAVAVMKRIKRKMETLQAAAKACIAKHLDPSDILHSVETELPPLFQSQKFAEAEAKVDAAIKSLQALAQ